MKLNIYIRFLNELAESCDEETYLRLEHELISIARADIYSATGEEMPEEIRRIYENYES